jgi:hypothetical protein
MAAAEPFCGQKAAGTSAVKADGLAGVLGAGGRVTAAPRRAKKGRQGGREERLIKADEQNKNPLCHKLLVPKPGLAQDAQKIALDPGQLHPRDGRAGNQHQIRRAGQLMLVQAKGLAQETARPAARDGVADFLAGDHAEAGRQAAGARQDVGNQAAADEAPALRPGERKFRRPLQAPGTREAQRGRRVVSHAGSNRGKTFAAGAAAVGEDGAPALFGVSTQKAMLAFAPDF